MDSNVQEKGLHASSATLTAEESTASSPTHQYISPFLDNDAYSRHRAALIILNTPIVITTGKTPNDRRLSGVLGVLWESSSFRVCADGGANRLYDATVSSFPLKSESESVPSPPDSSSSSCTENRYLPDLITGDLDSLQPHVREYYEARGVPIVRVEDQNYHDLDKSLMAVEKWMESLEVRDSDDGVGDMPQSHRNNDVDSTITTATKIKTTSSSSSSSSSSLSKTFIYGGFGGRFDQEMGCINALCVWGKKKSFHHNSMAVYGEETCAFVLPASPVTNEIRIRFPNGNDKLIVRDEKHCNEVEQVGEGPTCGLIPLGGRCDHVFTTGLKWNLEGDVPLEFGGLVSSSNRVMEDVVTVSTSLPMLFTTEMIVAKQG